MGGARNEEEEEEGETGEEVNDEVVEVVETEVEEDGETQVGELVPLATVVMGVAVVEVATDVGFT